MNNSYKSKNGGAWITPSPRPGIHDHANCPFKNKRVMVRYSAYGSRNKEHGSQFSSNNDQGGDEVDNVLSKFVHHGSSPVPILPIDKRRNSYDSSSPQNTDESTDDDEFGCEPAVHDNSAGSSGSTFYHSSHDQSSTLNHDTSNGLSPNLSVNQGHNIYTSCVLALLGIGAIIGGLLHGEYNTNNYDEPRFYDELNDIGEKYRINDNSILQVQTGISTIFEKQDAGSFIFVYNSRNHFGQNLFDNFMHAIASASARYLRNDSASVQHVEVDVLEFLNMESDSELIKKYREDVTRTGVMLVKELDRVPSNLAMAFHYYCDEYNPLVKKSAIFFTLDMAQCSTTSDITQPTHAHIEECLTKKWKGVPVDNIGPLLTRVVGIIVNLTSV